MKKMLPILIAVLLVAGLIYLLISFRFLAMRAPEPTSLPPVVPETMDTLLEALEAELQKYDPSRIQFLQAGISDEELARAETLLGGAIHPEMQALYRWHNGLAEDRELFPGHGFWPLELAIQTKEELNRHYREKGFGLFMAHEEHWLSLYPDSAGDGYYYDPKLTYANGGVFYNFREAGFYRYFPSIRNLLKAIVECYQSGAYLQGGETDFEIEDRIMNKYGMMIQQ